MRTRPSSGFGERHRRAFTRLIDLAIEKAVDFVLIAGDLYDGDWRDYNTGLYPGQGARPAARL